MSQGGGCAMGATCADIVGTTYDVGDGVYTIDPMAVAPSMHTVT